jgi:hypothetical protein
MLENRTEWTLKSSPAQGHGTTWARPLAAPSNLLGLTLPQTFWIALALDAVRKFKS